MDAHGASTTTLEAATRTADAINAVALRYHRPGTGPTSAQRRKSGSCCSSIVLPAGSATQICTTSPYLARR